MISSVNALKLIYGLNGKNKNFNPSIIIFNLFTIMPAIPLGHIKYTQQTLEILHSIRQFLIQIRNPFKFGDNP